MEIADKIAEQRIQEAIRRGELDDLPGAGKPLDLTDDAAVPETLRMAWRILKNAGYVPPEVAWRREIADLQQQLLNGGDSAAMRGAARRLTHLMTCLEGRNGLDLRVQDAYYSKLVRRITRDRTALPTRSGLRQDPEQT